MNAQILFQERPQGEIVPTKTFKKVEVPLKKASKPNEVLVEVNYLSLDPAMRGWMSTAKSYVPPVEIGEVMRALAVGTVIESTHPGFKVVRIHKIQGDLVQGTFGWQQYCLVTNPKKVGMSKIPNIPGIHPASFLGVLGITGLTAYFGLMKIGNPKPGETVVVSGAAGAVGSIVGQLAKIKGCRVVGIAGSEEKCKKLVDVFGFDAAVNYKTTKNLGGALRQLCPKGVDIYFDNVGGPMLDEVLRVIARGARIVICGAISQYNAGLEKGVFGPKNYMALLVQRARMEGFVYFDYAKEFPSAIAELVGYIKEGRLKYAEHIVDGLEKAPESLLMLFDGRNEGKLVVKVADVKIPSKL